MRHDRGAQQRADLTTAEVAELLAVSPATVKRWAATGVLPAERTPGGHRRFRREEVERFRAASSQQPGATGATGDWIELLLSSAPALRLEVELLEARSRLGSWTAVAASFGPVLEELGERWARGELTVLEEHVASARLSRVLGWAADSIPVLASARSALLATVPPEEHTLGLSLVEVCLRECGWRTVWAGRGTPVADLEGFARDRAASALVLSASVFSQAVQLAPAVERLAPAARETGAALVMGGRGPWPEPPPGATVLRTFPELREWTERFGH